MFRNRHHQMEYQEHYHPKIYLYHDHDFDSARRHQYCLVEGGQIVEGVIVIDDGEDHDVDDVVVCDQEG